MNDFHTVELKILGDKLTYISSGHMTIHTIFNDNFLKEIILCPNKINLSFTDVGMLQVLAPFLDKNIGYVSSI